MCHVIESVFVYYHTKIATCRQYMILYLISTSIPLLLVLCLPQRLGMLPPVTSLLCPLEGTREAATQQGGEGGRSTDEPMPTHANHHHIPTDVPLANMGAARTAVRW